MKQVCHYPPILFHVDLIVDVSVAPVVRVITAVLINVELTFRSIEYGPNFDVAVTSNYDIVTSKIGRCHVYVVHLNEHVVPI